MTGGVALENPYTNPAPSWLSEKSWSEIVRASHIPGYRIFFLLNFYIRINSLKKMKISTFRLENFRSSFVQSLDMWRNFYDSSSPQDEPLPRPLDTLTDLYRLVVLRCIRPDKVVPAVQVWFKYFFLSLGIEPIWKVHQRYMFMCVCVGRCVNWCRDQSMAVQIFAWSRSWTRISCFMDRCATFNNVKIIIFYLFLLILT